MTKLEQTPQSTVNPSEPTTEGKSLVEDKQAALESHGVAVSAELDCLMLPPRTESAECDLYSQDITSIDVGESGIDLNSYSVTQENGSNIVMTNETEVRVENGETIRHEVQLTFENAKREPKNIVILGKAEEAVVEEKTEENVVGEFPPGLSEKDIEREEFLRGRLAEDQPFDVELIADPSDAANALENGISLEEKKNGLISLFPEELADNSFDNSVITTENEYQLLDNGDLAVDDISEDISGVTMPDLNYRFQSLTQVATTRMPDGRSAVFSISHAFKRNPDSNQFESHDLMVSVNTGDNDVEFSVRDTSKAREILTQAHELIKDQGPAGIERIRETIKADTSGNLTEFAKGKSSATPLGNTEG